MLYENKNLFHRLLNTYRLMPVQVKASMWFVGATVLIKGISFVTVPVFTRLMTTEQYGLYSVFMTWSEILTAVGTLGLESCAYINILTKTKGQEQENAQVSLLALAFAVTAVMLAGILASGGFLADWMGLPQNLLILMVVQIFFVPAVNFWTVRARFRYRYLPLVLVSVSMAVLNAVCGILFVSAENAEHQALGRAVSLVLVQGIFGLVLLHQLVRNTKIQITAQWWKWALKLHIPLLPHTLSLKLLSGLDRIMIHIMVGSTAAAVYSVSYSVAAVVHLVKSSIVEAIRPWMYLKIQKNEVGNVKEVLNGILAFVFLLTILFVAFAPEVVYLAAPGNYYEAIYCMPPIMLSSFFTFLYSLFSIVEMYYEETTGIMVASILSACLNAILNYVFIREFGYIAAAFTTLVCYAFLAFVHYLMMRRVLRKNMSEAVLFDKKIVLALSILLLGMMFVFEFLYAHAILRYIFICVLLIALWIKRRYFIGLIKVLKGKQE